MADQPVQQNNSDEIDLGQLFQMIGRGFQKFFNFIASIFKGIFHLIMLFLLFVQKNIVVIGAALIIGGVGGFVLDSITPEKYISRMVVEPNFNSVQQLYNNIAFYNDLAKAQDSVALATALNITEHEAASIKEIFTDSYSDENQKIKLFDQFIKELDTTTIKAIDYENYLQNFNSMDARFHQISLISTDNRVAKKAQPAIINSISVNEYFKLQKRINDENLKLQEEIYKNQLAEIDSLQSLYRTVLVKEADKPMQGTSINLAEGGESKGRELALVQEKDVLKEKLVELNEERANKSTIINVISDFPTRGVELKGIWNSYKFKLPVFLLILVLGALALLELNRYLKTYNQK
ncbi:hypothetical protein [Allomuricauda sp.]|uniref:hypothetical protein n=1 Tax=Flagellimonas sp. TaxID=2058762 RepID=UPI001B0182F2|nr:hypothetical protein [Allomuricauda sp.]MBO6588012.1 hypothetical protein [Allomuricauda sp.]MBO6617637.1 hypothetical protein [Allomuricauda sp.]MBO6643352.1 hypothetical protein [Allomuricauda sp.]MBO6745972.1 hypothetical protein [Allomuricauda sp.]MBO6843038.1 hypothetical protein [Allomuricauda sp.]